jgi:hypothetical protein
MASLWDASRHGVAGLGEELQSERARGDEGRRDVHRVCDPKARFAQEEQRDERYSEKIFHVCTAGAVVSQPLTWARP